MYELSEPEKTAKCIPRPGLHWRCSSWLLWGWCADCGVRVLDPPEKWPQKSMQSPKCPSFDILMYFLFKLTLDHFPGGGGPKRHLVAPYHAIPRDYLSDCPLLRAMGFLVSQHGQLGAVPSPRFLSVSPLESMRSRGAIPPPPPKRGISAILARYAMKTRKTCAIPPSATLPRKGIARYWGGISHWAAKKRQFSDSRMHFWSFGVSGLCSRPGRLQHLEEISRAVIFRAGPTITSQKRVKDEKVCKAHFLLNSEGFSLEKLWGVQVKP